MSKQNKGIEEEEDKAPILQPNHPVAEEVVDIPGGKAKGVIVDLAKKVKVVITEKAPYHKFDPKEETVIECAPLVAEKMVKNGWGKIKA